MRVPTVEQLCAGLLLNLWRFGMEEYMKEIMITSSVLIVCMMLIRLVFQGKISSRLQYALWLLVALRLVIPSSAQIGMAVGSVKEFRAMDLVKLWEEETGDVEKKLEDAIPFTVSLNGPVGNLVARWILQEDLGLADAANGPTSVFLAGRIGMSLLDVLRGIWIGGMVVIAFWMLGTNIVFWRRLRGGRREFVLPKELQTVQIKAYVVDGLVSPCLYGLPGREDVYLTPDVVEDRDKLRHVLTHEMCHKKHGDSFWSLLRCMLLCVYWVNPFVWAAAVLSKRDCELACDEAVLLMLGEEERIPYGETLVSIITHKRKLSGIVCMATTMAESGKSVKERVRKIAEKPKVLGAAVAAVLLLVAAASVFVFTRNPQPVRKTWEEGELTVEAGDMQVTLPETIAKISNYYIEEGSDDLVVCQKVSGKEVGRFSVLSYGTAVTLMEEGREVVPLGDYGQNPNLKQYMAFLYDGFMYSVPSEKTQHTYTPNDSDSVTEHHYTQEDSLEGIPGTDSNDDDTTYVIEDESWEVLPLEEESQDYLPNEEIITTVTHTSGNPADKCYLYVKGDYSGVKEQYLEEMEYINGELNSIADRVVVISINQTARKEIFASLAENRTEYLGDASKVSALVMALPCPEGVAYRDMALDTGEDAPLTLEIHYDVVEEDMADIDADMTFFNAVMLFATVKNLEECDFSVDGSEGTVYNETEVTKETAPEGESQGMLWHYENIRTTNIHYTRTDLEEIFGELWLDEAAEEDGNYVAWIEDLYGRVMEYLK